MIEYISIFERNFLVINYFYKYFYYLHAFY